MGYALITPPASEPITLAEAKAQCRVDDTSEDTLMTSLISAARAMVENFTGRSLMSQTWRADFPGFPCPDTPLRLPRGPVSAVSTVYYYSTSGADTLLDAAFYTVDLTEQLGKIWLAPYQCWPCAEYRRQNAVRVQYVAGYATVADVPQSIKQAMLLLISQWFDNRSSLSDVARSAPEGSVIPELPFAVSALLGPHTIRSMA